MRNSTARKKQDTRSTTSSTRKTITPRAATVASFVMDVTVVNTSTSCGYEYTISPSPEPNTTLPTNLPSHQNMYQTSTPNQRVCCSMVPIRVNQVYPPERARSWERTMLLYHSADDPGNKCLQGSTHLVPRENSAFVVDQTVFTGGHVRMYRIRVSSRVRFKTN